VEHPKHTKIKMTPESFWTKSCILALVVLCDIDISQGFVSPTASSNHLLKSSVTTPSKPTSTSLTGSQSSNTNENNPVQGLVAMGSSLQSQLASAFSALDESDQYDAVLTGLCAKILDEPSLSGNDVIVALQDPIQLLEEMNSRRVSAGSRSVMALVDVSIFYHGIQISIRLGSHAFLIRCPQWYWLGIGCRGGARCQDYGQGHVVSHQKW
jgi:hypothetical protein